MIVAGLSDTGLVRKNNQDSYFISKDPNFPLFIIADGMGGHNAGEVASEMALNIIKNEFLDSKENLDSEKNIILTIRKAIEKANIEIHKKSLENLKYKGMGTTLTLTYIFAGNAYIGHIGDSRLYYINNKEINQITEDHSLVNELIRNGSITSEEAKTHPQKNLITRAVGANEEIHVDIHLKEYKMKDYIVLSSDGLTNMVTDKTIFNIVNNDCSLIEKCKKLLSLAKDKGGLDNITIIIIKFCNEVKK